MRSVLDILGVVDYGIYNVVGGVITIFAFINRTLSTSSQRYFSVEIGKGSIKRLQKWFCLNIIVFMVIGIGIIILLETLGLWFLKTKMVIPPNRMYAANVVYQLSILSFLFHIISIPYSALIVAHEKMKVFAFVGIFEAVGRLCIVFVLMMMTYDKLVVYGILVLLLSVTLSLLNVIYCLRGFPESKFHWYWNKREAIEMLSFSGWHFLGTFTTGCRSQGINILLNLFFGPSINAARSIAYQISGHVNQLSSNFFTAVKPQIYKSYAQGELEDLFKLMIRSTIICTFLVSIIAFPIMGSTLYLLEIWLKNVPEYAVIFTQLTLVEGLIESTSGPSIATVLATGRIKVFMQVVCLIILLNIPFSYMALSMGFDPTVTVMISIVLSVVAVIAKAYMLNKIMGFPWEDYLLVFGKILLLTFMMIIGVHFVIGDGVNSLGRFCIVTMSLILIVTLFYSIIISREDRTFLITKVRMLLMKR